MDVPGLCANYSSPAADERRKGEEKGGITGEFKVSKVKQFQGGKVKSTPGLIAHFEPLLTPNH